MISNTTKLERLAQAVVRYVSIKKSLFSFFYNSCKVLFLGDFGTFGQWLSVPYDQFADRHISANAQKRTAPIDVVLLLVRKDENYRLSSLSIYSSKLCFSWSKNSVREPARVFIRWKLLCISFNEMRNRI